MPYLRDGSSTRPKKLLPNLHMTLTNAFTSIAVAISLISPGEAAGQNPGAHWQQYRHVAEAGFSPERLQTAKTFYDSLQSSAFMIVQSGTVVAAWGDVGRRFKVHSIRKSLLNSLYGVYVATGTIDTGATIGELQISESDSLFPPERSAKVAHLLRSRSGVYHPAAAESQQMRGLRPPRGSHPPDSFWFYNNWDFNVLGTILENLAGTSIYRAFAREVALPLQMEEYRVMDGRYYYERQYSDHPAYHVKMSARDLARYGQLFLQKGSWSGDRIIPERWVETSVFPHSKHGGGTKIGHWYGLLWGVSEYYASYGMYFAAGIGGQFLAIFPTEGLILVNLCDTYRHKRVLDRELIRLFDLILAARAGTRSEVPELVDLKVKSLIPVDVSSQRVDNSRYVGNFTIDGREVSIVELEGDLVINDFDMQFRLLPLSSTRFFLEDIHKRLNVEFNKGGVASRLYYDAGDEETLR